MDIQDIREFPAYGIADAARYLHMPAATLRSWVLGRTYPKGDGVGRFKPLIPLQGKNRNRLTFNNLVEAHVLRALRTSHGVRLDAVRPALSYAEKALGIERLLLSEQLLTAGGNLFLERFGQLINISRSGQLALRRLLEAHLRRVDRDDRDLPIRLYPFLGSDLSDSKAIVIDPRVSFGRPTLVGTGISTEALIRRLDAGEPTEVVARDYDLTVEQVEAAVLYEMAA
jgi:uncharacterized protein (DUF433 family)